MSRIFEDNDAKALILISALVIGVLLMAALTGNHKRTEPSAVTASQTVESPAR